MHLTIPCARSVQVLSLTRCANLAEVMRWADVMLQKVAAVVQDLQDEKEGRRLSEQVLPQAEAFQVAPAMRGQVAARSAPATMFSEGDIGVLPPLGVWDPLGYIDSRDMRRYEEMEIKHGRAAMLGFTHVILTEAGLRFPGYLSDGTFGGAPIKFADVPAGAINTVLAIPGSSWAQIICLCGVPADGFAVSSEFCHCGKSAWREMHLGVICLLGRSPSRPVDPARRRRCWSRASSSRSRTARPVTSRRSGARGCATTTRRRRRSS